MTNSRADCISLQLLGNISWFKPNTISVYALAST
jgi:hypothetical protein